jgi:hypothetical protein
MSNVRYITLTEAEQLVRTSRDTTTQMQMLQDLGAYAGFVEDGSSKIILYEGDTVLPYLAIKDDIVLVHGNLTVTGILEDCLEVNLSLLHVLGNVKAQHLFTFSQICIGGDLTVANTIIADSLRDCSLYVEGDVSAQLILEDGHWFHVKGKVTANDIYSTHSAKPRGVLQPNLTDEELVDDVKVKDRLDLTKAMQYLMNNNFVFRK